ncbi:TIGR01777 family oxidoreductase [Pontibacillus yanchengensis]|uniref:TIGR01777 family oxidoreductase n=1 Tax=Pontibacillus yanchengensis TaxID=462910 RepID=UPI0009FF9E10|nr:TIGR01777 family oxidoreductase [Pontibacillus yanchengensis]
MVWRERTEVTFVNILISGGTGFIGKAVVRYFVQQGHTVFVLTRGETRKEAGVQYVQWMKESAGEIAYFRNVPLDACINLAGDPIHEGRWTPEKKERILTSRIEATRRMIKIIQGMKHKPEIFIQGSAIGYYGYSKQSTFTDESLPLLNSFPSEVCEIWENTFLMLNEPSIRKVTARIGIVLDHHGGALQKMLTPYQYFVGGRVASGEQWLSWIHLYDLVRMFHHIIDTPSISGPVNITAPNPVKMDEFGRKVAQKLHRPYWFPANKWMLRLMFGEMSEFIIEGQYVLPDKARKNGFTFLYPQLENAISEILSRS